MMKKVRYYIYCKLLYTDNKELLLLRRTLSIHYYKGEYLIKKIGEGYGFKQYLNTFLIYKELSYNENCSVDILELINILNKNDFIQILGIIKNNILIINYFNELKSNIFFIISFIYNIFIIKRMFLYPIKLIIKKGNK